MADQAGLAQDWLEFESELGGRPAVGGDLNTLLEGFEAFGQNLVSKLTFPPPDTSVQTEDKPITDGLKIRIYTPPSILTPGIVGLYTHSGGYIVGNLDSEDELCRVVSKEAGIKIVSVDYRLAPEHLYPTALNDSHAAAIWALQHLKQDDGSKVKLILIGSSAGGGLALGGALKLLDEGFGGDLHGVAALAPVTCHPNAVPQIFRSQYTSYDENEKMTINTKACMLTSFDAYGAPPDDKYTSPLLHSRLKDLPKVYLVCDGMDTLRDDVKLVKTIRDAAGASTILDEYEGYPHLHWKYPSKHLIEAREKFYTNLVKGIQYIIL